MNEQLNDLIVRDLSKQRSRNEIVRGICEKEGLNWDDAERLVGEVEQQNAHTIARRQSPLLIFLSAATLLLGTMMLLYGIQFFIDLLGGDTLKQILSLTSGYYRLGSAVTGIGMIVGGILGLWKTLLHVFET